MAPCGPPLRARDTRGSPACGGQGNRRNLLTVTARSRMGSAPSAVLWHLLLQAAVSLRLGRRPSLLCGGTWHTPAPFPTGGKSPSEHLPQRGCNPLWFPPPKETRRIAAVATLSSQVLPASRRSFESPLDFWRRAWPTRCRIPHESATCSPAVASLVGCRKHRLPLSPLLGARLVPFRRGLPVRRLVSG